MLASGTTKSHLSERAYKIYLKKRKIKIKNKINFLLFVFKKLILIKCRLEFLCQTSHPRTTNHTVRNTTPKCLTYCPNIMKKSVTPTSLARDYIRIQGSQVIKIK